MEEEKQNLNQNKKERAFMPFFFWSLAWLLLVGLDQLSKSFAGNIFRNENFAFSLPVPAVPMYLIYASVILAMGYYCFKNFYSFSSLYKFAWVLIFSGAFSNVFERIALGYVRDFIYILDGVFNFADFYIIVGALILLTVKNSKANA